MVCYKLHMRGFTMARPMAKEKKGNYLGFLSCLGELKELGVTTLEFMPLYDFEEVMYDPAQIAAASARHPMQEIEWEPARSITGDTDLPPISPRRHPILAGERRHII